MGPLRKNGWLALSIAIGAAAVTGYWWSERAEEPRLAPAPVKSPEQDVRLPVAPTPPESAVGAADRQMGPVSAGRASSLKGLESSSAISDVPRERAGTAAQAEPADAAVEQNLALWLRTLRSDPVPGNRLGAIDQLRVLGKQGDRDGRIESSLRAAMNDRDPSVAVNARDALSDLLD